MKTPTMKNLCRALVMTTCSIMITACAQDKSTSSDDVEKQVEEYVQEFPYRRLMTTHAAHGRRCRKAE